MISERKKNAPGMRVGIAGAGLMGHWHARAAKKAGGKVIAVADSNGEKAKTLASQFSSARYFASVAEMIMEEAIDVLHVCAPTADHYEIAEAAIKAGINLFIEKPLAATVRETEYLYELADVNDARICPAHQFAFQRSVEKAEKMLSRIGRLIHLQATICSAGGTGLPTEKCDEIAFDILPHPLSLFQKFLNDPLAKENFDCFSPQAGELRVKALAGDISLGIFISLNARPTSNSFRIVGANGTIHLDMFHDFAFVENGKVSKLRKILRPFDSSAKEFSAAFFNLTRRAARFEPAYPGLQNLIGLFYRAVREKREPPVTAAQAISIAQIRDYLIARAAERQTVGRM